MTKTVTVVKISKCSKSTEEDTDKDVTQKEASTGNLMEQTCRKFGLQYFFLTDLSRYLIDSERAWGTTNREGKDNSYKGEEAKGEKKEKEKEQKIKKSNSAGTENSQKVAHFQKVQISERYSSYTLI